jgi:hypothetical protein|tara:strand:+ start:464 stop:649 length:186 start_codon:yes stop_codon:yes gene_type:complete
MTPRKKKASVAAMKDLVAQVGIEQGEWRVEAGESLSGAPEDLDVAWLLEAGRIREVDRGED